MHCQNPLYLYANRARSFDQALKRFPHQFLARLNVAEDFVPHHKESAIDPNVGGVKRTNVRDHSVGLDVHDVKTGRRLHQEQRSTALLR